MTRSEASPRPKVIDLYCGAGGLSLGAARAGFDVAAGVEWDHEAISTHSVNFPATKHLRMDVGALSGQELLDHAGLGPGQLAGIIGGPPCQGFSIIGERNPDDTRNALFGHFMRLVSETKPAFFVAENVPGIGHQKNAAVLQEAMRHVASDYHLLPALHIAGECYGAPTSRRRLFFIGVNAALLPPLEPSAFTPPKDTKTINVRDALQGLNPRVTIPRGSADCLRKVRDLPNGRFFDRVRACVPPGVGNPAALRIYRDRQQVNGHIGVEHAMEIAKRYADLAPGEKDPVSRSVRLKLDGYCPTLRAGTGPEKGRRQAVRPIHPTQARVITPREAARLQGFPDWFVLPKTKWHSFRQLGNSVSPIVAEEVLSILFSHFSLHRLE